MNNLKGVKTEKKSLKTNSPKVERKNMEVYTLYIIAWIAVLTYVPYKLYKIIDRFADDINPYNFSKRK